MPRAAAASSTVPKGVCPGGKPGNPFEILHTAGASHAGTGGTHLTEDDRVVAEVLQFIQEQRQLRGWQLFVGGRIADVNKATGQQGAGCMDGGDTGQQCDQSNPVHVLRPCGGQASGVVAHAINSGGDLG
jgi:hypothetical protein